MFKHVLRFAFILFISGYHLTIYAVVDFEIKGVDDRAKENIFVFLKGATEPNDVDNDIYLKKVKQVTLQALTALGYYQSKLKTVVSGEIGKQTVSIDINIGEPTRITNLHVEIAGEGKKDPRFQALLKNFPLKINAILDHGLYEKAKIRLSNVAQRCGYFDARFEKSRVEVSSNNNHAVVYLLFNTGVRYQFGKLVFDSVIPAEKQIRSLLPFTIGDPFTDQVLSEFNTAINNTGYFKNITIYPNIKEKQGKRIPLHIIATMYPEDSFNIGLGYSTDQGIRGKFRWSRPWANDYGHSINANMVVSIPEQEASFTYKIPLKNPLTNYFSIQSGLKTVNQNDTELTQYLVSFNRHWRLSNNWLRTLFIRYNSESGRQGEQNFSTRLFIPGISFRRTRSRGGVNADWGDKLLISLEASNEWWLSTSDLVKAHGQVKILRSYNGQQFLAYSELGAIYSDSIYNVPSSMRFFTGGDQSIRGYDYESIAPTDEHNYLIGGRYLAVASLEYRFPISQKWKMALFSDVGTATNDFSETISSSAGIGIVWSSPIGPIRFYLAKPFTKGKHSLAAHFIIGPEL